MAFFCNETIRTKLITEGQGNEKLKNLSFLAWIISYGYDKGCEIKIKKSGNVFKRKDGKAWELKCAKA